jgi:small conductance mechanosensitive channel
MHPFLLAVRTGWFAEGHFMGKVLNEWVDDAQEFVHIKLPRLIFLVFIAFLLFRLLTIVTTRMIRIAEEHAAAHNRVAQVKTMANVVRATGITIILAFLALQTLASLGVNLAPLLASAGVAGVAIGLAAQNIVRDMLNGLLILIEDQFNEGETVTIAGVTGVVESMTLRKTTLRNADGTLYVVPNSQITTVANQSIDYSVATVNVSVDYSANPDDVTRMLTNIAMEVRNGDDFRDVIIEDPKVLGVDAVKGSEQIFPVVFKTLATQQFGPVREFRRRVRLALEKNHVLPGDPGRIYIATKDIAAQRPGSVAEKPTSPAPDPTTIKPNEGNPFSGN